MQVRTAGAAATTGTGYQVPLAHELPRLHIETVQVRIIGLKAKHVGQNQQLAETAGGLGLDGLDDPVRRRVHRRAARRLQIEPRVKLAGTLGGMAPIAEATGDTGIPQR